MNHEVIPPMPALIANAGVPMIFWQLPVATIALLPITLVELLVVTRIVRQPAGHVGIHVFLANLLSTFVGIPIAWAGMLAVNLATTGGRAHGFDTPWEAFQSTVLQASWLVPYEHRLVWLIPTATLVLLIPYFLVSVVSEHWYLRRRLHNVPPRLVTRAAWLANAVTYSGLFAYTVVWLARAFG